VFILRFIIVARYLSILAGLLGFTDAVQKAYKKLMEDVDEDDADACALVMAPILEDLKRMELDVDCQLPAVTRMKSVIKQASALVCMRF
jgi:hypothetical protein